MSFIEKFNIIYNPSHCSAVNIFGWIKGSILASQTLQPLYSNNIYKELETKYDDILNDIKNSNILNKSYRYRAGVEPNVIIIEDKNIVLLTRYGGCLSLNLVGRYIQAEILTPSKLEYDEFLSIVNRNIKDDTNDRVFAITNNSGQLGIMSIGQIDLALIRENYEEDVLEKYDAVIKDLNSSEPNGQLVIIDGEPGTGKTYLLRGMIKDAKETAFLILSPNSIGDIQGPNLLPLFISFKDTDGKDKKSITVILEDADDILVPRDAGNMSLISALLNATDGILGQLINLRVIATTNARRDNIDEALLRPGRLSQQISVGKLSVSKSNSVYQELSKTKDCPFSEPKTLAEVYAYGKGTIIKDAKDKPLGFLP